MDYLSKILPALFILIFLAGCDTSGNPPVYPVTGVVTWQGKPVEGAEVAFAPVPPTPDVNPARAMTDASGRYRLQTYFSATEDVLGCRPGDYQITIIKVEPPKGIVDPIANPEQMVPKHLIPPHYADSKTSNLKATVEAKAMQFDFVLKDEP